MRKQAYVYGPVPSRRLGRSLGVDLVPFKTCTYDCIYCQLGRTTQKTIGRREWVPTDALIDQLKVKLGSEPEYVTLSGSGEPTLHSRIGDIISRIKQITDVPVAVLTNGSLLWMQEVRNSLIEADLVLPSLDAGTELLFNYVNRPHHDIPFGRMLDGLVKFRDEYTGRYWLEVILLSGVTTVEAQLNTLSHCMQLICPDKVQIGTITRPPAEDFAIPVPPSQLRRIARESLGNVEVVVEHGEAPTPHDLPVGSEDVLELLRRRPCSIKDIAQGLGLHRNEVLKHIEQLQSRQQVAAESTMSACYFRAVV